MVSGVRRRATRAGNSASKQSSCVMRPWLVASARSERMRPCPATLGPAAAGPSRARAGRLHQASAGSRSSPGTATSLSTASRMRPSRPNHTSRLRYPCAAGEASRTASPAINATSRRAAQAETSRRGSAESGPHVTVFSGHRTRSGRGACRVERPAGVGTHAVRVDRLRRRVPTSAGGEIGLDGQHAELRLRWLTAPSIRLTRRRSNQQAEHEQPDPEAPDPSREREGERLPPACRARRRVERAGRACRQPCECGRDRRHTAERGQRSERRVRRLGVAEQDPRNEEPGSADEGLDRVDGGGMPRDLPGG